MSQIKPTVEIIPLKHKLEANREHTLDVLIKIKSPADAPAPSTKRPKLNISVVLDRSGSMGGRKIIEAIQATKTCIDNMLADDRLGCVTFDDNIEVLFPNQPVTDKKRLHSMVDRIVPGGSTALHAAWVRGGLEVTNTFTAGAINRILLVTDGEANVGLCNPGAISKQARELAARGVSTTTIGIGDDFNEDLLIPMAEAGAGNSWHVKTAEDMTRIFDVELNGLVNQFGHSATLGFRTGDGVEVIDVLNDFETAVDGRKILPNLTKSNDLDVVVRLRISERTEGSGDGFLETDLSFIGQTSEIAERVESRFAFEFVSADEAAKEVENTEAAQASLLLNNARDRKAAIRNIDYGNFSEAEVQLRNAVAQVSQLCAMAPSEELEAERDALSVELQRLLAGDHVRARKYMAYRSFSRPRGKFDQNG